jgi:hypothetical protein
MCGPDFVGTLANPAFQAFIHGHRSLMSGDPEPLSSRNTVNET